MVQAKLELMLLIVRESLAQRHLKPINDIETAITGRRTRIGTCGHFSNKDNYVAKLKRLQTTGANLDEDFRTEPYSSFHLYGETLAPLLSETHFLVKPLTVVQFHGAARYLERLKARLAPFKVQLLKLTSKVKCHFKKGVKRFAYSKRI